MEIVTKNSLQTKKLAGIFAEELPRGPVRGAIVIALSGNLGSGKTTFVQGFARALGIKENVLSPTFVLMKIYNINSKSRHLVHIDCYRVANQKELIHLGFRELLKDKDAIIFIEWAEKIKKILPQHMLWLRFKHGKHLRERIIAFKS